MKIKVENLGFISSGEININDLTIIFGKNNVGKTYLSYATYGILSKLSDIIDNSKIISKQDIIKLKTNGSISVNALKIASREIIKKNSTEFTKNLSDYFNTKDDYFEKTNIEIEPDFTDEKFIGIEVSSSITLDGVYSFVKKAGSGDIIISFVKLPDEASNLPHGGFDVGETTIAEILSSITSNILLRVIFNHTSRPFVITSERTGVSLFYKEMDSHRSSLINSLMTIKTIDQSIKKKVSTYSTPISDNINTIRKYEVIAKRRGMLARSKTKSAKLVLESLESILSGTFTYANGETVFTKKGDSGDFTIPISISSSSVKSLFLFDLYIKHVAKPGDFLVIDEPELNLHPENQIKMAGLIVRLVNAGIKVIMTTHSDYIIKEINNRIMLSNIKSRDDLSDFSFANEDALKQDKVSAFTICDDRKIKSIAIDEYGINQDIFDNVIISLNERSDSIFDKLTSE